MIGHEGGFEFEWQSDDLVYRVDSCHPTYVWNASHQTDSVTSVLPDAASVRRFIDRALTQPDEHTSLAFESGESRNESVDELLGFPTTSDKAPRIIATYDNPFLTPFAVTVEGRRIADKDETIRVLNERVKTLFDDRQRLVTDCDALRGRVDVLEDMFASLEGKLYHTMFKSGFPMCETRLDTSTDIKVFTRTIEGRPRYVVNGARYANGPVDFFIDIESMLQLYDGCRHVDHMTIRCDETINTSVPVHFKLPLLSQLNPRRIVLVNLHVANNDCLDNLDNLESASFATSELTLVKCKMCVPTFKNRIKVETIV